MGGLIDLADAGSEGARVAEALRVAGFEVRERTVAELADGTEAGLVILAGDAPGAMETLGQLRRRGGTRTAPILLVGTPATGPSDAEELVALGADAVYRRPVEVERLARKVETFFAPAERRLRAPAEGSSEPPASGAPPSGEPGREVTPVERPSAGPPAGVGAAQAADDGGGGGRPEPTIQLSGSSEAEAWAKGAAEGDGDGEDEPVSPAPDPVRRERAAGDADELGAATTAPGPELSPRLQQLFREADRRMFPEEAPLPLRFPGGDEPPEELVPDELLASVSLPIETVGEDALEAFTFVGSVSEAERDAAVPPPPMAPSDAEPRPASSEGRAEGEGASEGPGGTDSSSISVVRSAGSSVVTSTGERGGVARRSAASQQGAAGVTVDALEVGEPTPGGEGRRGELGRGEAVHLLWRLHDSRVDALVSLQREDGPAVELVLREGQPAAMQAPVATVVLEALRGEGRVAQGSADEQGAWSLLERAVRAGLLVRLEVDRRIRHARDAMIHGLVEADALSFEVHPAKPTSSGPSASLLSAPLPAVLVEGARRRLDEARVAELLGAPERLEVRLADALAGRAREALVPPELVALLERHRGDTLAALLAEASPEDGVAGLVFALSEVGAVRLLEGSGTRGERPVEAVRRAVEAATARADEGSYFALLGVGGDAPPRELRAAWVTRRRELVGLPLAACGLESLEPARDRAIDALDEAWSILRDERLRKAYRAALAAVGERC